MPMVGLTPVSAPIPRAEINTSDLLVGDRFDAWREFDNVISDIEPGKTGCRDFEASAVQWSLGELTVSKKAYGPHRGTRNTADRRIKWNEFVRVRLHEKGHSSGLYDGKPFFVKPGDLRMADLSKDCSFGCSEPFEHITVLFPYKALGYDPSRHPSQLIISNKSPQGRMLEVAFRCLIDQIETVTVTDAPSLAMGITGLVRGMMFADRSDEESCAQLEIAQRAAMRNYIDEHLDDMRLSAELLGKVFNASRATVYRHFKEAGGVCRYVRDRRLDYAFGELSARPMTRGCIRAVAERWGFFEAGHFNRVFRQRFGISPSEVAALGELAVNPARHAANAGLSLSGKQACDGEGS